MTRTAAAAGPGTQVGVQMGRGRDAALMAAASLAVNVPVARGGPVTVSAGVRRRVGVPWRHGSAATLAVPVKAGTVPTIKARKATRRDRRSQTT